MKCIQTKVTRIVKCLEMSFEEWVCHFVFKKVVTFSLKDTPHLCRAMLTSSNYLKSCHVKLGFYVFKIVLEGKTWTTCGSWSSRDWLPLYTNILDPIAGVVVSALFLMAMELPCGSVSLYWVRDDWDGLSHIWLKDCMTICHSAICKCMTTKLHSAILINLACMKSILWKIMLLVYLLMLEPLIDTHSTLYVECSLLPWRGCPPPYLTYQNPKLFLQQWNNIGL